MDDVGKLVVELTVRSIVHELDNRSLKVLVWARECQDFASSCDLGFRPDIDLRLFITNIASPITYHLASIQVSIC